MHCDVHGNVSEVNGKCTQCFPVPPGKPAPEPPPPPEPKKVPKWEDVFEALDAFVHKTEARLMALEGKIPPVVPLHPFPPPLAETNPTLNPTVSTEAEQ